MMSAMTMISTKTPPTMGPALCAEEEELGEVQPEHSHAVTRPFSLIILDVLHGPFLQQNPSSTCWESVHELPDQQPGGNSGGGGGDGGDGGVSP